MNPLTLALAFAGLITSATTRVTVVGHPVPVLWLLAVALVLALAVAVLVLVRLIARDFFRLSPYPRTIT